ncbi:MAG TPA: hypothetical protein PK828_10525 [Limnochordia bacterium]|nr:hypothetical protein [Limnochordia bacterium]
MRKTILMTVFLLLVLNWSVVGAGVRPLILDLDLTPGDRAEFEITLTPGAAEEIVDLSFYQPIQLLDGSLNYLPADPAGFPAANWITLERNQVRVIPGAETSVKGTVQVPFSAGGTYVAVIMVEPQTPVAQQGITFRVRYAIRLNIRVNRPGLLTTCELTRFELVRGEDGQPVLKARLKNTSPWDYLVSGEITIRDDQRRLVERILIMAESLVGSNYTSVRLYPGYEVEMIGEITRKLTPGEYQLRGFFRYGDRGQIIHNEVIRVNEGDFNYPAADAIGVLTLEPQLIDLKLRPGKRRSQSIQIQSEVGDDAYIAVTLRDVRTEYPYSLLNWIELRNTEVLLRARSSTRIPVTLAVPRDAVPGSYHGNLVFLTLDPETGKPVSEKVVPVSLVIGDEFEYEVDVRSLAAKFIEGEGHWLSVDLYNSSNVMISPQITLVIFDKEGNYVHRAELNLPEGVDRILPLNSQQLETVIPKLENGIYSVELEIRSSGKQIAAFERSLEI